MLIEEDKTHRDLLIIGNGLHYSKIEKIMKIMFSILLAFFISTSSFSQNRTGTVEFSTSRNGHTAKIIFSVGAFASSSHKIIGINPCDDYKSVFIFMDGGDGSGNYQVLWVLRLDGKHSRFSGACSDCGFIDFYSGFFQDH